MALLGDYADTGVSIENFTWRGVFGCCCLMRALENRELHTRLANLAASLKAVAIEDTLENRYNVMADRRNLCKR